MIAVSCSNVTVGYDAVPVLRNVSFELPQGESLLILGHNASGKTTLLRTLFGLQRALEGRWCILGIDMPGGDPKGLVKKGVRYLGQGVRSFDEFTVGQSRSVLSRLYGLAPVRERSPSPRGRDRMRIKTMSLGQRRLEALTLLAAGRPQIFLLDEPTAGLDPRHVSEITGWIDDQMHGGISFIIVEHDFRALLNICQRAMVLRAGMVSFLGSSAKLRDDELFASVFL